MLREHVGERRAVVFREIANKGRAVYHVCLETGKKIQTTIQCKTCKGWFPHSSFYLKSKATRRNDNDVRPHCCDCYDAKVKLQKYRKKYV